MSAPPKTVLHAEPEEAEAIREAVRRADVSQLGMGRARAGLEHVPGLVALLSDERVSGPIYDLPRPITDASITRWVLENLVPAVLLANRQREEPAPWFALRLQHKDMRIAVETASALGVPLAAGALSAQLYAVAEGLGWGDRDQVGAVGLYADAAGIERWRDREMVGEPAPPLASNAQNMAITGRG